MKAMILAAGLGTRLRPLSLEIPKPVIPVLGLPLCGHAMAFLHGHGAESFLLNLHHGPEAVREKVTAWAADRFPVEFTHEPEILGTGGGIGNAREYLRGGTFVTANSDAVARFPLGNALSSHRADGALATLVLFPDRWKRYTAVRVRDDGRILGFGSAAPAGAFEGFYTGHMIAEPELLDRIPRGRPSCIVRDTFIPLIARGAPIFAFVTEGDFLDFGTPADYLRGTLTLLAEREPGRGPRFFAHPRASIGNGATVGPDAVVEEGASVGSGATVRRAILWPGAVVPPGALVENGILTPRGFVPA
jgi:NDP-sugar pyrophosphorylase family protein